MRYRFAFENHDIFIASLLANIITARALHSTDVAPESALDFEVGSVL